GCLCYIHPHGSRAYRKTATANSAILEREKIRPIQCRISSCTHRTVGVRVFLGSLLRANASVWLLGLTPDASHSSYGRRLQSELGRLVSRRSIRVSAGSSSD